MVDAARRAADQPERRTGVRVQRVQPAADPSRRNHGISARRLEAHDTRLGLHPGLRVPRPVGRFRSGLAGARRSAQERIRGGRLLGCWLPHLRRRRADPPGVVAVHRLRRDRRVRARPGLHHADRDTHPMVSGSSRHGHRHGRDGLRWWCHHRGAAVRHADESLRVTDVGRRRRDVRGPRRHVPGDDADRRVHVPASPHPAGSRQAGNLAQQPSSSRPTTCTSTRRPRRSSSACCG